MRMRLCRGAAVQGMGRLRPAEPDNKIHEVNN